MTGTRSTSTTRMEPSTPSRRSRAAAQPTRMLTNPCAVGAKRPADVEERRAKVECDSADVLNRSKCPTQRSEGCGRPTLRRGLRTAVAQARLTGNAQTADPESRVGRVPRLPQRVRAECAGCTCAVDVSTAIACSSRPLRETCSPSRECRRRTASEKAAADVARERTQGSGWRSATSGPAAPGVFSASLREPRCPTLRPVSRPACPRPERSQTMQRRDWRRRPAPPRSGKVRPQYKGRHVNSPAEQVRGSEDCGDSEQGVRRD